ncbi:hypothetical protein NDU88_003452 [Pleurodeles waltl]|uniref:Uncharacterized protein n=1 Tax=Pleurodeles waltl TaxID=8319 RepID=A0AAV7MS90_PLEWA|nr:hypothetical protein NDU88_003452 [Pleurodeles waltl]
MAEEGGAAGGPLQQKAHNLDAIMVELHTVFKAADARFHMIVSRLGTVRDRMDRQATHIQGTEHRISQLKNSANKLKKVSNILNPDCVQSQLKTKIWRPVVGGATSTLRG